MMGTEIPVFELPWGIALSVESDELTLDQLTKESLIEPGFGSHNKGDRYDPLLVGRLVNTEVRSSTRLQLVTEAPTAAEAIDALALLIRTYSAGLDSLRKALGTKVAISVELTYFHESEAKPFEVQLPAEVSKLLGEMNIQFQLTYLP